MVKADPLGFSRDLFANAVVVAYHRDPFGVSGAIN